ncbi:hypothetical protein TIFTF001_019902 [Ficus carica]|uniref:Uncharacterized protein n=1 Tax=Ficus carica TaxID=3494 RepID=A0AA88AH83_FICCA|nr:hypothetical protein TIFTF001_019902 [Ficus carica]
MTRQHRLSQAVNQTECLVLGRFAVIGFGVQAVTEQHLVLGAFFLSSSAAAATVAAIENRHPFAPCLEPSSTDRRNRLFSNDDLPVSYFVSWCLVSYFPETDGVGGSPDRRKSSVTDR